jgi:hypothetical protein
VRLLSLSNKNRMFYGLLGRFLSRREIVKELGSPVWDDPGKTWIVALDGVRVVGFCAYRYASKRTELCSDWVTPDRRHEGIYHAMFSKRLESIDGPMRATVTDAALPTFLEHGFERVGQRGRFTRVEK